MLRLITVHGPSVPALLLLFVVGPAGRQATSQERQNIVDNTRVPTGQVLTPAGRALSYPGRPVALAVYEAKHGTKLLVKDYKTFRVIDGQTFDWTDELPLPGGASLTGILCSEKGEAYVSNAGRDIVRYRAPSSADERWTVEKTLELPADSFPGGMALNPEETQLTVCLSKRNSVALVDLSSGGKSLPTCPSNARE